MLARFFVDRPVFATVISIVIVIVGLVALIELPVAQYPEIAPPVISITALYPGANAQVVADTVATPIEAEVNGVENMLYMSSRCTNDGQMIMDVTFRLGVNIDMAQVLVQNRVSIAQPKLPDEVKKQGVTVKKKSPSILLCVNVVSEKTTDPVTKKEKYLYDRLYMSNYVYLQVKDSLARLPGVGDVSMLGARDYSMRVWLDPEKLAARSLKAGDVVQALREQNVQVAAGRLGQPPAPPGIQFQLTMNTLGRLDDPNQFRQIVIKTDASGSVTYLGDVVAADRPDQSGVELGAKNYDVDSFLNDDPSSMLAVFQLPGSNALETAKRVKETMRALSKRFPKGLTYKIVYDTTVFIDESIHEVYKTLFEAFVLVFIVVLLFLQDWRATLMPMIDVPVSLIGTFAVMSLMGFSLNNLSLFGLVLAIGIVVDDAIVVVENIERWMAKGLPAREATIKAMEEITGAVIAITLVLAAVFIPTAIIAGIAGQFYKQFALTIATSTIISAINAMTMAPARAVTLIKPHKHGEVREALPQLGVALIAAAIGYAVLSSTVAGILGIHLAVAGHGEAAEAAGAAASGHSVWVVYGVSGLVGFVLGWFLSPVVNGILGRFFIGFNWCFDRLTASYGRGIRWVVRLSAVMLLVYGGLIFMTFVGAKTVAVGFIPQQDKGYMVVHAQLPEGASLERTHVVMQKLSKIARGDPAVEHCIRIPGYSIVTSNNLSNVGGMFVILKPFEKRAGKADLYVDAVVKRLRKAFYDEVPEVAAAVFGAPPVDGLGSTGGIKMQVQDRVGVGLQALQGAVANVCDRGNTQPGLVGLFTTFSANQPQLFVDSDRVKAKRQGISLSDVFDALQTYLGSTYANDISLYNRNWQVYVQADSSFRLRPADVGRLRVRNANGDMVPLSTLCTIRDICGPAIVNHYNMFPSADVSGNPAPGTGSGEAIAMLEKVAGAELPSSMGFEWTEIAFQQSEAAKDLLSKLIFPISILFVFLVLASLYESWSLPMAIMLIVPMCLSSALFGLWMSKLDLNLFAQIGLIVLVGLAAKNAILVVEFAKQLQDEGKSRLDAVVESAATRLRPILMTAFAFILGVVPLAIAKGAGAEMRVSLGVTVFSGMLGVTLFGLVFTPVFYFVVRRLVDGPERVAPAAPVSTASTPEPATPHGS
ncbi:MAG: efflux RND transporter permease subunit [Candidatus Riflebacteria bacterium]|nr:efflux RND transporter permease subunit [Candidatus Riflebacteria bacterium]